MQARQMFHAWKRDSTLQQIMKRHLLLLFLLAQYANYDEKASTVYRAKYSDSEQWSSRQDGKQRAQCEAALLQESKPKRANPCYATRKNEPLFAFQMLMRR